MDSMKGKGIRGDFIEVARVGTWLTFATVDVAINGQALVELADAMQRHDSLDYARQNFDMVAPSFSTVMMNGLLRPRGVDTLFLMNSRDGNSRGRFFYLGETPADAIARQTDALMGALGIAYSQAFELVQRATAGRRF